uniref:Phosphatidylethanolamine-binding protein n=1 Tax=Glossina brevipalpis TaxID=37001 RepID=A0A1A9W5P5_9MUSC
MFFKCTALLMFALMSLGLVLCSQDNDVEEAFKEHNVVPDVVDIAPEQFLEVIYDQNVNVKNGDELTPTQVKNEPKVVWTAQEDEYYTLIMTDPDAPSRAEPKFREFRHWLVANIPGNQVEKGEVIAGYIGSGPPKGTGLHRYVFLLYKQHGKMAFNEKHVPNNSGEERRSFHAMKFAEKYDLGSPVAGNFFQAQWDEYVPTVHKQLSGGK